MGLPVPNLDDKTFDEFVEDARSLIARFAPEWTDYNVHDPGMTFIELFAWLAEMQIYRLNWVTEHSYEKFLKLVAAFPDDVRPARVDITFQNVDGKELPAIPKGTQVATTEGPQTVVFETQEDLIPLPAVLTAVKTISGSQTIDHTQANEHDRMYFAPFGENGSGNVALLLGFDQALPEQAISITVLLFDGSVTEATGDEVIALFPYPKVVWEYLHGGRWNALHILQDTTRSLARNGRVVFDGPPSMQIREGCYWIRCCLKKKCNEIPPLINKILLNTVPAIQVETIQEEILGTGLGIPGQQMCVKKTPVLRGSQKIWMQEATGPCAWEEVDNFESSGPNDRHYRFDTQKGALTFGNGFNGRIPPSEEIRATYKTTLGAQGNIGQGQHFEVKGVEAQGINTEAASGGKAAESLEDAKIRARKNFILPSRRAITSDDYEKLALATPGLRVARAQAIPQYDPNYPQVAVPGAVTVVVVPRTREEIGNPEPSERFLQTILRHLNMRRLATTEVHVIGPEYIKITVVCQVYMKKKSSPTEVESRVRKTLCEFLNPFTGGPDQQGWPFGRSVFSSEIYQIIDKVQGVNYVTDVTLSGNGTNRKGRNSNIEIPRFGLVYSGEHQVTVVESNASNELK